LNWAFLQEVCNRCHNRAKMSNDPPLEGAKTMKTPTLSKGLGFSSLSHGSNFIQKYLE